MANYRCRRDELAFVIGNQGLCFCSGYKRKRGPLSQLNLFQEFASVT
jgi:hypothetical protein